MFCCVQLRNQAQMELRALRAELAQEKANLQNSQAQRNNISNIVQHEDYKSSYMPRI